MRKTLDTTPRLAELPLLACLPSLSRFYFGEHILGFSMSAEKMAYSEFPYMVTFNPCGAMRVKYLALECCEHLDLTACERLVRWTQNLIPSLFRC